jgi:hypothetical protein
LSAASRPHTEPVPTRADTRAACPIAEAIRPLRTAEAEGGGLGPLRVDVVETLATLLDLTGSLALAAHLDAGDAEPAAGVPALAPTADLDVWVDERIEQLRAVVERRLRDLHEGRSSIWGPERLAAEITGRGLLERRPARAVSGLAREACEAHALAIRGLLDRVRGELRGLRVELAPRLAALGPRAARIEALDARLGRARAAGTHRLVGRIPPALIDHFAGRLVEALRAVDPESVQAAVGGWYASDGLVSRHRRQAAGIVRGVLDHEARALHELVAAAESAEADADGTAEARTGGGAG